MHLFPQSFYTILTGFVFLTLKLYGSLTSYWYVFGRHIILALMTHHEHHKNTVVHFNPL